MLLCDISTSGSVSLFVASQETSISSVDEVGLSSPEAGRLRRVAAQKRLSVSSVPRRHLRPSQDAPAVCCREKSWLNEVGPRAGLSSRRAAYREGHRLRGPTSGPSRDPVLEPLLQRPTTLTRQGYSCRFGTPAQIRALSPAHVHAAGPRPHATPCRMILARLVLNLRCFSKRILL